MRSIKTEESRICGMTGFKYKRNPEASGDIMNKHYLDCLLNSAQTMAVAVEAFSDSAVSQGLWE